LRAQFGAKIRKDQLSAGHVSFGADDLYL